MIEIDLDVVPHGLIESGSVKMQVDEKSGLVCSWASILVGVSIFNKTIASNDNFKVDPNALIARNFKPGMKWIVAGITIDIVSIADGVATASVSVSTPDYNLTGAADLDVTGQYVGIKHVLLNGVAEGQQITLELEP